MVRRIIEFALKQPLFLGLLTLSFIAAGVMAFRSLPIEAFPDVTDVQVTVITLFPGHAPEEVEKQITVPLEIGLSGIPHSVKMFSHTQFGLSYIILTFDDQVTDYFARQQVLERLQGVDLPPGVQPGLAPLSTPIGEIYRYRVIGKGVSSTELRSIQDWMITRHLKMVPGVADVVSLGGLIKQYEVELDLLRMKAYQVSLQQVYTALGQGNSNAGGNYLEQGEQQFLIRGIGLLRSSDDIGNVLVTEHEGTPLFIKDIARVRVGAVPRQGVVGQDQDDDVVTGIVVMRKGENPSEVLADMKSKIDALNRSILPKGVEIVPFYDRTWLIETTLKTVFKNLIEGAVLVTIVLFLFLGRFRPAMIVAAVIPLALLGTFIGLRLKGIPANLLSLGAMDFGIIVDGAVIVVENIFSALSHHTGSKDRDSVRSAVIEATAQVGRPTFFSMIIIILAHLPIFTLQRQEGRIFAPMAYTIISALVGSLVFSLTLVPLLSFYLLRTSAEEKENILLRTCKRIYRPILISALNHKKTVLGIALSLLLISLISVSRLGSEFLPELNEGAIWVSMDFPPGISVTEVSRLCALVRTAIREVPEVKTVISKAGRPEDGTDPKLINMAEFFVDLKPASEWRQGMTKEQIISQMERSMKAIPGIEPSFSQPIRDNILESISQIKGQIIIKIFSQGMEGLQEKAQEVLKTVSGVRGVARAFIDRAGEIPQLQIEVDRARAGRYGMNVSELQEFIETALGGRVATEIWEGERRFGVVVRLPEEVRGNVEAVRNLLIDTPNGVRVPLDQVATIHVEHGSMNLSRESGMRVAAVGIFIRDRDMGSVVQEMQERVGRLSFPAGYWLTWGGEFENQQRAMARLEVIVPVSIFLIFVLLFNAFKSAKHALLILLNVPFALIGGIFALLVTGIPLSVSAAVGFIALFGQAVLNGVVMVSYFNEQRRPDETQFEIVVRGALARLRTVLMTALLAMLGLLPMALSHGIGSEVQKPLAVVIIGGLISATLLTLIVLPVLYLLVHREKGRAIPPMNTEPEGAVEPEMAKI